MTPSVYNQLVGLKDGEGVSFGVNFGEEQPSLKEVMSYWLDNCDVLPPLQIYNVGAREIFVWENDTAIFLIDGIPDTVCNIKDVCVTNVFCGGSWCVRVSPLFYETMFYGDWLTLYRMEHDEMPKGLP